MKKFLALDREAALSLSTTHLFLILFRFFAKWSYLCASSIVFRELNYLITSGKQYSFADEAEK